ncbi:4'-phosphopantetheinyl transferase superfamily protein [Rheinheimera sp.]|uniref:4'-phosphopantetheinyl transferase family protein n=1 Tax=Rheinheimera sp. TaxID=1869214 RepID=UPI00307CDCA1
MPLLSFHTAALHSNSYPDQFIDSLECWRHPQGWVLVCCHFQLQHYRPDLYASMAIEMPAPLQASVIKRQAEFLAGRYAAFKAMQLLWPLRPLPQIGIAAQRQPLWPAGALGSITHAAHWACCLISRAEQTGYLGIDLETWLTVEQARQLCGEIHNREEQELLCSLGLTAAQATTLIFSAKESLFKAVHPYAHQFFGFDAATVKTAEPGTVWLELKPELAKAWQVAERYSVNYQLLPEHVFTILHSGSSAELR